MIAFMRQIGFYKQHIVPMTLREFASSHPNPAMRRKYHEAIDSLDDLPFNPKDGRLSTFIKNERMPETTDAVKPPRAIQARPTRFAVTLGALLKPFEEALWGKHAPPKIRKFFAKCMNPKQIGARLRQLGNELGTEDIVYIENDYSRFDSTQSKALLQAVHQFYRSVSSTYRYSRTLRKCLHYQLRNHGRTRGGIKYTVEATCASGDYDTSLKGCIINFIAVCSLMTMLAIPFDVIINGDDSVIAIRRGDLEQFQKYEKEHFKKLGLLTKMLIKNELSEVSFCQGKVINNGHEDILVRDPVRAISHASVCTKPYGGRAWLARLRAGGECELATNPGIPVVQSFALRLMRESWRNGRVNAAYERDLAWRKGNLRCEPRPVTERARVDFWRAFGIPPDEQRRLERFYDDSPPWVGLDYTKQLDALARSRDRQPIVSGRWCQYRDVSRW